jgi:hypothetical protein
MTLDKHQIDGIGSFCAKVLPASEFEELMTRAGYTETGMAPAQGGRHKVWWVHPTFRRVESINSADKTTTITAYHVS